jgi:OmpA family
MRILTFIFTLSINFGLFAQSPISATLYFESGKSDLSQDKLSQIQLLFDSIDYQPNDFVIAIEGFTDFDGSERYNKKLATNRCNTIKTFLKSKGIFESNILSFSFGESKPINQQSNDEEKAQNRRVVVQILPSTNLWQKTSDFFHKSKVDTASFSNKTGIEFTSLLSGSSIYIAPNAIVDENGNPVNEPLTLYYREYRELADFVAAPVPMTYIDKNGNVNMFESAGMYEIRVKTKDGKNCEILPTTESWVDFKKNNQVKNANYFEFDEKQNKWILPTTQSNIGEPSSNNQTSGTQISVSPITRTPQFAKFKLKEAFNGKLKIDTLRAFNASMKYLQTLCKKNKSLDNPSSEWHDVFNSDTMAGFKPLSKCLTPNDNRKAGEFNLTLQFSFEKDGVQFYKIVDLSEKEPVFGLLKDVSFRIIDKENFKNFANIDYPDFESFINEKWCDIDLSHPGVIQFKTFVKGKKKIFRLRTTVFNHSSSQSIDWKTSFASYNNAHTLKSKEIKKKSVSMPKLAVEFAKLFLDSLSGPYSEDYQWVSYFNTYQKRLEPIIDNIVALGSKMTLDDLREKIITLSKTDLQKLRYISPNENKLMMQGSNTKEESNTYEVVSSTMPLRRLGMANWDAIYKNRYEVARADFFNPAGEEIKPIMIKMIDINENAVLDNCYINSVSFVRGETMAVMIFVKDKVYYMNPNDFSKTIADNKKSILELKMKDVTLAIKEPNGMEKLLAMN